MEDLELPVLKLTHFSNVIFLQLIEPNGRECLILVLVDWVGVD